jgi:hypothetical protein
MVTPINLAMRSSHRNPWMDDAPKPSPDLLRYKAQTQLHFFAALKALILLPTPKPE